MRAAVIAAAIGGTLAVVEGLLLIALGSVAGLAENPERDSAVTGGLVVLALGGNALTAVFVARRWPFVLAVATAASAAVGFLVENALWVFAAAFLLAASALAAISKGGELRFADRNAKPS
jgi:hypothetical protein